MEKTKQKQITDFLINNGVIIVMFILVIVAGLAYMGINAGSGKGALAYSLEFKGGTSTTVEFNDDMTIQEIEQNVVPVVAEVTGDNDIQTQKVAGTNEVIIKTKTLDVEQRQQLEDAMVENFGIL